MENIYYFLSNLIDSWKRTNPIFLIEIEQNQMKKWKFQAILVCILKSDLSIKERLRLKRYYFPIKKGFREVYLHALHDSQ